MIEEDIRFKTSRGLKLAGLLLAPNAGIHDIVVFAHGTASNKFSPRNRGIAEGLLKLGIASFLFDFTGHGESDGLFHQSTKDQQFDDLISAIDYLDIQTFVKTRFVGVNGSSTGGAVAIRAAAEDARIQVMALRVPRNYDVIPFANLVKAPTLVIQGSEDQIVLPEAKEIYEALGGPKELLIIEGAGHLFDEKPEYLKKMTDASCAWFENWLKNIPETD
ncbi:MAG: alpha/beta fold hydrolase [Armatimonadetes bacterium]|nr:alpha/beta fold hydrolase [Armatimonadota bacterium]